MSGIEKLTNIAKVLFKQEKLESLEKLDSTDLSIVLNYPERFAYELRNQFNSIKKSRNGHSERHIRLKKANQRLNAAFKQNSKKIGFFQDKNYKNKRSELNVWLESITHKDNQAFKEHIKKHFDNINEIL